MSYNPRYDASGKLVLEAFPDYETAMEQAVLHNEGRQSEVWRYHCPERFQFGDSVGGLDVFYIKPCEFDDDGKPIVPVYAETKREGKSRFEDLNPQRLAN